MQYAYLGFVESLQSIFRKVFESVLAPVLTDILKIFIDFITNSVWVLLSELLINFFTALCSIIDFLESIFDVFSGVAPVKVSNNKMSLLQAMFEMEGISTAFLYITVMAVAICIIFTIYKTVKSISDMAMEDKNPISKVLTDVMKAIVTFMMIPFLCIFLLQLSSAITKQVNIAFASAQGTDGSIGTVVFLAAGMDADKQTTTAKDIRTGQIEKSSGRAPAFNDSIRGPYMAGTKDYRNMKQVKKDFHSANFDYLIGFTSAILLILILAVVVLKFIRRIFELLLLYLVSPLFVSTIPLDDGAIFARWRELFVAKFFSGFGSIFAMKYYLMVVPYFTSSNLVLYDPYLPNGTMINNVLRLFLIVGGAWAVYHGQTLVMDILAPQISFEEKQMGFMVTGLLTRGTSMAFSAAQMGAMGAAEHMKNSAINTGQKFGSGRSGDKEGGDSGQKFEGAGGK